MGRGTRRAWAADQPRAREVFSVTAARTADMVEVVDWCGIASGHTDDKSHVFEVFRGELPGAPLIKSCAVCAECRLVQATPYGVDTLHVAEIVTVHAQEQYLTDGRVDWAKVSPLLFTFPEPSYWKLGEYVGKAWSIGRGYDRRRT
jgi:flavin reductase (DIM6/NTAB) family NADH-FMN oxidoreductase RutF